MPQAAILSRSARFRPKLLNSQDILARPRGPRGTVGPHQTSQTSRLFLRIYHGQTRLERSSLQFLVRRDERELLGVQLKFCHFLHDD